MEGRYYIVEEKIPCDEDLTHEFKGHTNFTKEQVPPFANDPKCDRPSRQPISKTVNAFLNTHGGTIYLGIADDGRILGIMLNQYKMDHILQNVKDMMSRYSPPVLPHRYSVHFVPALNKTSSDDEIKTALSYDPSKGIDEDIRNQPHSLRSFRYCWCDKALFAQTANGMLCMQYVIEIHIKPWDADDFRNANLGIGQMKAKPLYENEEAKAYYRGGACIREFTVSELQALATDIVLQHYQAVENGLKQERGNLIRQLPALLAKRLTL